MSANPPHPDEPAAAAAADAVQAPAAGAEPAAVPNGIAIAALALGVVGIATGVWTVIPVLGVIAALVGFVPGMLAIILGAVGRHRARQLDGAGRGPATAGLVLGIVTLAVIVLTALAWVLIAGASAALERY
ncbi:hypothetical protein ARHIZOSPH14_20440 [Agromyces rhizosphaerae]|uniref:DUF4190 domain-containing protein n=1 Tax=Agromyces rhizosphaerae TaxID=88374 RepID=A0A9W6CYZ4_9MICO|nr:hypothetical protein [Agromyces rhizosphaerae]GLI27802.1 hypothetical protein ARHIZOSPH14_20440 [Agromyces rhizosphaerae]